ncbi:hypothetical protein COCNU_12G001940 [Cocos nucifera]|uniref:Uncharacterized protein n=1 Tax=Cocos nucifera TaxID=13894 RepID=A0A8K0N9Q9_COCNU|nr:hypothetical protein COCNU_12G001940 [Cocos nucifera]
MAILLIEGGIINEVARKGEEGEGRGEGIEGVGSSEDALNVGMKAFGAKLGDVVGVLIRGKELDRSTANELKNVCPSIKISFISITTSMEKDVILASSDNHTPIPHTYLTCLFLDPINLLLLSLHLLRSIVINWKILPKFHPWIIVSTSGYIDALGLATTLLGIKIAILK